MGVNNEGGNCKSVKKGGRRMAGLGRIEKEEDGGNGLKKRE